MRTTTTTTTAKNRKRPVVILLDLLVAGLAALVVAGAELGGFVFRFADFRISFRTPFRALLWLVVILVVRVIIDRRSGPLGVSYASWRRALLLPTGAEPFQAAVAPGFGRRLVWVSLGIALALAVLVHDQLRQPYSVLDLGDPLLSMWRIAWVLQQLVTDPAHLFDADIFYPERLTLALSDPVILPALTAAPLLAVGIHPVVAYNLLLLSGFWFSGIATYVLVERLTGSPRAAFIAGLIFACYPYRFEHYGHLELQMTHWMPLGLLALHLLVLTGRWPYVVALGVAGVAQLYSSMYYAVFFLVYAAVIGSGLLVVHRPPMRRLALQAATAALLAGLIAVPIVRAFVAAQPLKGDRTTEEISYYSATISDYLRANSQSARWRERTLPPEPERALFPGIAPLAIGAIGLAPPLGAIRLVYVGGLLVSLDCSFGMKGLFYPFLHRWFEPIRGLRVPARFSILVGLTLSIFAGFGARRVLRWCRSPRMQLVAFAAMMAAVIIDAWPALVLQPVWKAPPPIYEVLNDKRGVVLAEFPVMPQEISNTRFMYFSLWHRASMINGYSGFIPPSYTTLVPDLLQFPRGDTVATLRRRGVTHVTVNCGLQDPGCEATMNLMRQHRDLRLIAETRWQGRPAQIYEVTTE